MSSISDKYSSDEDEDCTCINCLALESLMGSRDPGYEGEVRKLVLIGRNKEPFPDWDMVSGFFYDWINPFFRGPNLYSVYRLFTNNLNRHQWMSGCPGYTNFWCLPCTLFGNGEKGTDFNLGEINLPEITSVAEKHGKNARHLKCYRKMLSYEQPADFRHIDEKEKLRIFAHDENIRKRRALVCFMINAIVLLASQGVPFRMKPLKDTEHDRKVTSKQDDVPGPGPLTEGMFYHTIDFLREHTENEEITNQLVFGMTEWLKLDTQTKLISAIADTIRKNIRLELDKAEFVSIIIIKPFPILDIDCPRVSTIVRYVDDKGGIHETCLGLNNVEHDHFSLISHLSHIVELYSLEDKLVAVACDGGALLSTQFSAFQNSLLDNYPGALLVHCYGQTAENVVYQSLGLEVGSTSSFLRLFDLTADLFRGNVERQKDIREFISRRSRIQQPLNFDQKLIRTMDHYRNQFIDYFIAIPNKSSLYDSERENGVLDEVCKFTKEVKSAFCLKLFSKIFVLLESLNCTNDSRGLEVSYCAEQFGKCLVAVKQLKDQGFDSMWSFVNAASGHLNKNAEDGEASSRDSKTFYKTCFDGIMDNIIHHLTVRFGYLTSVDFISLLDPKKFSFHCKDFPEESFISLTKRYLFQPQLKDELKILYCNDKLYNKNIGEFLQLYKDMQPEQSLCEVKKLVTLLRTFPLFPHSLETSKYIQVENYIRLAKNIDLKESLSDLSLISLEKSYIGELDSKSIASRMAFDEIIDSFAEKMDKKPFYRYINPN
uniref:Hydroxyacylglutathione hydrolase n=4 Tax=Lygus hesperus TaxID=30085 RepID=A0A0A9YP91_LYGHE